MNDMRASIEQLVDAKLRVLKHLPEDGDLSLTVLKGHLLVEELLSVLVQSAVKYPRAIEEANLGFYQLASMAKALVYEEGDLGSIWDSIFALNQLRNSLAHNLEPPDLEKRLRRFFGGDSGGPPEADKFVAAEAQRPMRDMIAMICGVLMGYMSRPPEGAPGKGAGS
jgi:hypothetical protein